MYSIRVFYHSPLTQTSWQIVQRYALHVSTSAIPHRTHQVHKQRTRRHRTRQHSFHTPPAQSHHPQPPNPSAASSSSSSEHTPSTATVQYQYVLLLLLFLPFPGSILNHILDILVVEHGEGVVHRGNGLTVGGDHAVLAEGEHVAEFLIVLQET